MEDNEEDEPGSNARLWKQGAEAKIYTGQFLGRPCVIKERFSKAYRHPQLDSSLTQQRTKAEVRAIMKCRTNGIQCPAVYFVDLEKHIIFMENISDSVTVRDHITTVQAEHPVDYLGLLSPLAERIGSVLSGMHEKGIIHGDLTTSNMLLRQPVEALNVVLIDFGLSYMENMAEDKGVDLYVLERAFLSTHPNTEALFEVLMRSYTQAAGKGTAEVMKKLEEIRMRGRKRTMVG